MACRDRNGRTTLLENDAIQQVTAARGFHSADLAAKRRRLAADKRDKKGCSGMFFTPFRANSSVGRRQTALHSDEYPSSSLLIPLIRGKKPCFAKSFPDPCDILWQAKT
jgi:hypothetical protein